MDFKSQMKEVLEVTAFVVVTSFFVLDANGYLTKEKQKKQKTEQESVQQVRTAPARRDSVTTFRPDSVMLMRAGQKTR